MKVAMDKTEIEVWKKVFNNGIKDSNAVAFENVG
jgi:hypothetical protein